MTAGFQKFIHAYYAARPVVRGYVVHLSFHNVYESVYISLPSDFLGRLLLESPDLKSLDLSPGFLISYSHVIAVKSFHRCLTTLSLAGVQAFSTVTLRQFLAYFPRLTRLDLSGTSGVSPSLVETLPTTHLNALRLRHQPFKINDSTVVALAQSLHSNLSELDLSFALASITITSISAIEEYCQSRPPQYSSNLSQVDIGPGPKRLGLAYTSIPLAAINRLLASEMVHLVALDIAGIQPLPHDATDFWQSLHYGGSFTNLTALRLEFVVFTAFKPFDIRFLPSSLMELSLHNVPAVERDGTTYQLVSFLSALVNPFLGLKTLNLEMAPKGGGDGTGMYAADEEDDMDEVDVIEEIKGWKRRQKVVWTGSIRVVRDVVGSRGYAQEFGSGVGDILGAW